ncbi:hypothetical protein MCAP1_000546 [Malassezia caprae]|uniref:Dopey N-terminal domain-containing protein n=1 Tax=Malassezia caprae TaxID=1381934 RepID=A0AAF0E4C3_9BASI|nr:hypothetical protein MCAP1_000546 [Malassezia caprae]
MAFRPDTLVTRQVATHATSSTEDAHTEDIWRTSAAKQEQKRWAEQSEKALYQDSAFKRHQGQVDKVLAKFDSVAEWADFISFLGRLLKALQAAPQYNVIPNKLIVAKRLSQCLNPALPSGVHARALEVYTHIFSVIGVDGLRRDLPVWTPGLLPFFPHAATSIKPVVLGLYETYYLPLGVDLRPVTRAMLLSLLPGLEEESSEFFDRVVALLDRLSHSVQLAFFLQTMWHVMIMTPSVRLCAFHYLARRMPRVGEPASPPLESLHVSLLSCAVAQTLHDDTLLVRRQALDFLVQHMSLTSTMYAALTPPQRASLVDAALGTVLRRDISLNRRLYAWLLGTADTDEAQQAYFCEHALSSVTQALQDGMARDTHVQRPFKVLVSLMDKRALAQPLLGAIVLDVFAALQQRDVATSEDVYPTAQTLFEALDAHVLYQQLYQAMVDQVHGRTECDRVGLFRHILSSFEPHDEDAKTVYLPILCMAMAAEVHDGMVADELAGPLAISVVGLLQDMVERLDARAFRLHTPSVPMASLREPAAAWFSDTPPEHPATLQDPARATALVEALLRVALQLASNVSWSAAERQSVTRTVCTVVKRVVVLLDEAQADAEAQVLSLASWSVPLFQAIAEATTFDEVHDILRVALQMNASPSLDFCIDVSRDDHLDVVMEQLLTYLQPDAFPHHEAAVALFVEVCALAADDEATRRLCTHLSQPGAARTRVMNALGTLWRLDERACSQMEACLFLILDRLRSHDTAEKHECELWLCAHVSSYDALLTMLVDHLVRVEAERAWQPVTVAGRAIPAYVYAAPFDQAYMDYYLATLASLISVAGSRALRAAQDTAYTWPDGVERYGLAETLALADVLKHYVIVLLRSLPGDAGTAPSTTALSLEVLRLMLAIEPPAAWCEDVEAALVDVLLLAMHRRDGDAQIMVLRTLREVLLVQYGAAPLSDEASAQYLDLVQRGLVSTPCDTVFFAWTDLAHTLLPLARHGVHEFMLPLCVCVQSMLVQAMPPSEAAHQQAMRPSSELDVARVPGTALEINQMISLLEHALVQALSSGHLIESERSARPSEPAGSFLVNISSVFLSDSGAVPAAQHMSSPMLRPAAQVVQRLMYVWVVARADTQWHAVVARSFAALGRFYGLHAEATLDALVEQWWHSSLRAPAVAVERLHAETVELLEALAGSAQIIFTSLCDSIAARMPLADRSKRAPRQGLASESVLVRFLETYAAQLDAESLAHVWPVLAMLVKSVSTTGHRAVAFDTLRLVTVTGTKLAQTRSFEDTRMRRDIQDAFVRLYELVITLYARTLDVSSSNKDSDSLSALSEREDSTEAPTAPAPAPAAVVQYLGAQVVPALGPLMIDTDKSTALCTSLVYYVIAPGFKARSRGGDWEPLVLDTLAHVSRVPHSSKTWRTPVLDTFMDPKFFAQSPQMGEQWAPIVAALLEAERERLTDIIGRIVPTPSSNLFTSRESDLQARVCAIRRLSYAVYAEKRNAFLAQLPQMQEKVVEILRSGPADLVHAELYLLMRVLLCRFDSQHLTGFWPIILTEVLRILVDAKAQLPKDDSDRLHLLFSVAKLADFLITLQTDDFQIYQWLLITDTPDALCASPSWAPESLLDALGQLITQDYPNVDTQGHEVLTMAQQRRPMLQISRARSLSDLVPFFLHASCAFYENESAHEMDWDNINQCLLRDLFEPIRVR